MSDLHFGDFSRFNGLDPYKLGLQFGKALKGELLKREVSTKPDFIIITGDITESAKPPEFKQSLLFCESLSGELGIERERFIIIPGNHDVSWPACKRIEADHEEFGFSEEVLRINTDKVKFNNFINFKEEFISDFHYSIEEKLDHGVSVINFEDLYLSFGLLNSCEKESHKIDDHYGFISRDQAQCLLDHWNLTSYKKYLKFILIHHNPIVSIENDVSCWIDKLKSAKSNNLLDSKLATLFSADCNGLVGNEYIKRICEELNVQIIFHGHHHKHSQEIWPWKKGKNGFTHVLSAGSLGLDPEKLPHLQPNEIQFIEIDTSLNKLQSWFLVYNPLAKADGIVELGDFVSDPVMSMGYKQDCYIPDFFKNHSMKIDRKISKPQQSLFIDEYRKRLCSIYLRWDLRNVGVTQVGGSSRPIEANLDDMYQPIRLAEGYNLNNTNKGKMLTPRSLIQRKNPIVIRGAAGSGKTTWMRWTFRQLLKNKNALPIMIELRKLVKEWYDLKARGNRRSLDYYLNNWISENIGSGWKSDFQSYISQQKGPKPILFVDGWDELGELGEELRAKLLGFMKSYPNILVVVSSRPYGDSRPSGSEGFKVYDIQPFSDNDIEKFAENFFTICYRKDSISSKELQSSFISALKRSDEARVLARTALLLTMMLLISRSSPLPDKRHQLYGKCIENLLTALPDRYQEEGVQLSSYQWRPENGEERFRVLASIAYRLQCRVTDKVRNLQENSIDESANNRSAIIVDWDSFLDFTPKEWDTKNRNGFLVWLTERAGVIVNRADGTLSFSHLSFQEYLCAWHLNVTIEGDSNRLDMFVEKSRMFGWWETLRLWSALLESQNPERLSILIKNMDRNNSLVCLFGCSFADGLGTSIEFEKWLIQFSDLLKISFLFGYEQSAIAWTACKQNQRKEKIKLLFESLNSSLSWTAWTRFNRWISIALSVELKKPMKGSNKYYLTNVFDKYYEDHSVYRGNERKLKKVKYPVRKLTKNDISINKIFLVANPFIENWEGFKFLLIWPSYRCLAGLLIQNFINYDFDYEDIKSYYSIIFNSRTNINCIEVEKRIYDSISSEDFISLRHEKDTVNSKLLSLEHIRKIMAFTFAGDFNNNYSPGLVKHIFSNIFQCFGCREGRKLVCKIAESKTANNFYSLFNLDIEDSEFCSNINVGDRCKDLILTDYLIRGRNILLPLLAICDYQPDDHLLKLFSKASRIYHKIDTDHNSLLEYQKTIDSSVHKFWLAYSRHLADIPQSGDTEYLSKCIKFPEKLPTSLSKVIKFIVRGDAMFKDGKVITLDELSKELDLPPLPYIEKMRRFII